MAIATGTAIAVGAAALGTAAVASTVIGGQQAAKAQDRALSAAEAEQARAREEQQRLEEKYGSLTPEEQERSTANYELSKQRQAEYERRAGLTGEQLVGEGGTVNQALIDEIRRRQGMTGEELFASEGELNRQIGQEALSNDPYALLAPELELARMSVNQEANRRGVFGGTPEGGIRFEQLGRANVDLAVKAAAQRIAQRNSLANAYLTLGSNARAESGTLAERSLSEQERARAELQNFLSGEQNLSEAAKGRTTGAGIGAANIGEAGAARAFNTTSEVFGQQQGAGAALQAQGLASLGNLGGTLVANGLMPAGGTAGTELSNLRGTDYDSIGSLSDLSGSSLADEYSKIRRG